MRTFLLIAFSLATISAIGQVKQANHSDSANTADSTHINIYYAKDIKKECPPLIYVNSSLIYRSIPYIDPIDISSIDVKSGKDYVNKTNGQIFITLKKRNYHFITIDELTKKCIPDFDAKKQAVIYVIDDKLIDDATDVVFESSYIKSVEILDHSKDVHHIGPLSNVIALKISTQSAPVYVKGTASEVSIKQ